VEVFWPLVRLITHPTIRQNHRTAIKPTEGAKTMTMPEKKKRVLLIGEQPDIELFTILGEEGYEVAALESPHRARDVFPLYKPHVIILFLRYPKEVALLEECLAMAGTVPVVAAISLIAKPTLVKAVKEKATAFVVLPAKRQTIRETLQAVALFADEAQFRSGGKKILGTDSAREKRPHSADSL
jgi:DNA-binding NtrC family response regulator